MSFLSIAAAVVALAPLIPHPASTLELTTTRVNDNAVFNVRLQCGPAGGTHPRAEDACAQLAAVDGEISRLPHIDTMCTMELDPIEVRARGKWDGQWRSFDQTYSNKCVMLAETKSVFDF